MQCTRQTTTKYLIDRAYPAPVHADNAPGVHPTTLSLTPLYLRKGAPPVGEKRIFTLHRVGQLELLVLPANDCPSGRNLWLRTPDGKQHRIAEFGRRVTVATPARPTLGRSMPTCMVGNYPNRLRPVPWGDVLFAVDLHTLHVWGEIRTSAGSYMVQLPMRKQSPHQYILW